MSRQTAINGISRLQAIRFHENEIQVIWRKQRKFWLLNQGFNVGG